MSDGLLNRGDLFDPTTLDTMDAQLLDLTRRVDHLRNRPNGDSDDPCDLARRIARLEVRARDLQSDELTRWLENLRGLVETSGVAQ